MEPTTTPAAPAVRLDTQEKIELALHHVRHAMQGGLWCASAFIGGVIKGDAAEPHDPENPAQVVALQLGQQLGPALKEAGKEVLGQVLHIAVAALVVSLGGVAAAKKST